MGHGNVSSHLIVSCRSLSLGWWYAETESEIMLILYKTYLLLFVGRYITGELVELWVHMNIADKEATLCQNILKELLKLARISKFHWFHETKQTQNEVGNFFYNLSEFVFEFRMFSKILPSFAKFFFYKSLFATWSYRYLNPKRVIQRALKLPSHREPPHPFGIWLINQTTGTFIAHVLRFAAAILNFNTCGR